MGIDLTSFLDYCRSHGEKPGEYYEKIIESVYNKIVKEGDGVIDGGAHIGRHAIALARLAGDSGQVYAFEPAPRTMLRLVQNVRKNGVHNILMFQFALSDTFGLKDFNYFPTAVAMSGLGKRHNLKDTDAEVFSVVTVRMDTILERRKPVSFIKLDLEGGEYHALRGARAILEKDRPIICFENGRQAAAAVYGYEKAQFFGYFEHMNYQLYTAFGDRFERGMWRTTPFHFNFFALPTEREEFASEIAASAKDVVGDLVHSAGTVAS